MNQKVWRVTAFCDRDILESGEVPLQGYKHKVFDQFFSTKEGADGVYQHGVKVLGLVHGIHWYIRTHFIDSKLHAEAQLYDIHEALRSDEPNET